ncbi:MAG: response regulator [Deltaproteobacteria bacterium]|nr:response regulator [Deltaproteobacteria bacterium]
MTTQAKILIIDDDAVFIKATQAVLESKNYQVSSALDGDEGLKKAKQDKPDLIILDIVMPAKDGFAACEQLKSDPELERVPVLIMTSFSEKGKETNIPTSAGFNLEAEDYAEKPLSPEELLRRVEKLLKRS